MLRPSSLLPVLFLSLLFVSAPQPVTAQSAASVVDNMQAAYQQQLGTVDTYIVETNLYTSYHKKVMRDGEPAYETHTRMKGDDTSSFATSSAPSTAYGMQFDRLRENATYVGTETVDGVRSHVLRVDDPSSIEPDLDQNVESMTYYVDADRHVPVRLVMQGTNQQGSQGGPQASSVTINMKNYTTVDGLTLPHRMEIQLDANLSEEQQQKMEQAMKQMENMPEQQRKQMEKMVGNQMEMMKKMMAGDPVIIEVQSVQVNTEIPEGIF